MPLLDLLDAMLQTDPRVRPTAGELLTKPYFSDIPDIIAGTALERLYEKPHSVSCCNVADSDAVGAKSKRARDKENAAAPTCAPPAIPACAPTAATAAAGGNEQDVQHQKAVGYSASALLAGADQQRTDDRAGEVEGSEAMCIREVIHVSALTDGQLGCGQLCCEEPAYGQLDCGELDCALDDSTAGPPDEGSSQRRPAPAPPPLDQQDGEVEEYGDVTLPPPPAMTAVLSCGIGGETLIDGGRGSPDGCRLAAAAAAATVHHSGARREPSCLPIVVEELVRNKAGEEHRDDHLVLNDAASSAEVEEGAKEGPLPGSDADISVAGIPEPVDTAKFINPSHSSDSEGHVVSASSNPSSRSVVAQYSPEPELLYIDGRHCTRCAAAAAAATRTCVYTAHLGFHSL